MKRLAQSHSWEIEEATFKLWSVHPKAMPVTLLRSRDGTHQTTENPFIYFAQVELVILHLPCTRSWLQEYKDSITIWHN